MCISRVKCLLCACCQFCLFISANGAVPFVVDQDGDYSSYVKSYVRQCGFEKGEWGNETFLVLPVRWNCGGTAYILMSRPVDKDKYGNAWLPYAINTDNEVSEVCLGNAIDEYLSFSPDMLHLLEFDDGHRSMLYFNEIGAVSEGRDFFVKESNCRTFVLGTNGVPRVSTVSGGVASLFRNPHVKVVARICPKGYKGEKCVELPDMPAAAASLSKVLTPERRREVMDVHLKAIGKLKPKRVFMIVGDVNGDGVPDAYISSDVEEKDGECFQWTLYVGGIGGMTSATNDVRLVGGKQETYVDKTVTARKDRFFAVNAEGMPNHVLVMVDGPTGLVSWAYLAHENGTKSYRQFRGDERICAGECLNSGRCQYVMKDVRDLFSSKLPKTLRVERLDCHECAVSNGSK